MKKISTIKNFYSLALIILFFGIIIKANSQTNVTVSSFQFSPASITINVGETVTWTNTGGTHNVNGTTTTFPSNPESFGNEVGSGWVYSHVFSTAGSYNYQCNPHASGGMTGTLTVMPVTAIFETQSISKIIDKIYPNPFNSYVTINLSEEFVSSNNNLELAIFNILGERVESLHASTNNLIETSDFSKGVYFYQLKNNGQIVESGKIIKQ